MSRRGAGIVDPIGSWIAAARHGEPESLGKALESFRGYLLSVARGSMEPDLLVKGGASDLVQETFLDAYRDFGRFEGGDAKDLCVWLRGILMHRVANFRRRYRETEKRRIDREVSLTRPGDAEGAATSEGDASPSQEIERLERSRAVLDALGRLPERHRVVILLRHEERLTFGEIGLRLGISEEAARKRWGRAVERVREELQGTHERR
jgi:RNA polymerase sigma-70 factor (ECF subfamily)